LLDAMSVLFNAQNLSPLLLKYISVDELNLLVNPQSDEKLE
jgi:hypothetical protein